MKNSALVVGVSGIAGSNLAEELIAQGWTTYGLARNPLVGIEGLIPVKADILQVSELEKALASVAPTHVFFTTWMRGANEDENIQLNSALVRHVLAALSPKNTVKHVALVTGLKHYLGPFDSYVKSGKLPLTPVREEHPRLPLPNFYYNQEDEVYQAAARDGFTWSIHRPHTIVGCAKGTNLMNMGTTLAVYASICKAEGKPMIWPGSEAQWNGLSDVTDAKQLAKQLVWAAQEEKAANQAFNIVNGDVFRWNQLWFELAAWFEIEALGFDKEIRPLQKQLEGKESLWKELGLAHGLKITDLNQLASPWHTDLDLGRPLEVVTEMSKSRQLGFSAYQTTRDSFFDLFEKLRTERFIP
ncbi:SDR family oxidoreductase [Myroides sp. WP-1]|uniref:SDR family oxidoreductase n=1 Tax=Myroides sp. WP-1 TaxID=2759944 RepID=UPI0015FD1B07|nr:SDR family oxidoreductase [Myroides sp. WP-1]MBB1140170.1 SDR family oxidoreductase [Myroides sp. WP-1]